MEAYNELLIIHQVIQSDLFGMVKWPFQMVKWPPTRGWKGHLESPGSDVFVSDMLVFQFEKSLWTLPCMLTCFAYSDTYMIIDMYMIMCIYKYID